MDGYIDPIELIPVCIPKSLDEIFTWKKETNLPYQKEWIFRGQRDGTWGIKSSLERHHDTLQKKSNQARNIYKLESGIWHQFISIIESELGRKLDYKVEKASILQHYKVPTRLIDFTKSLDVALYFAITESDSKYCTVYALNYTFMKFVSAHRTNDNKQGAKISFKNILDPTMMDKYFAEKNTYDDEVILINPEINSQRIKIQEGCFLLPSNLNKPASVNINNSLSRSCVNSSYPMFFKILINESIKNEIRKYLAEKNLTTDRLFPEDNNGLQEIINEIKKRIS